MSSLFEEPEIPSAPSPTTGDISPNRLTREALETELEFRPRFREQDIQDLLQLGKAVADLQRTEGFRLTREERALMEELEPETFAVQRELANRTLSRLQQPLTPQLEASFRERLRSEEALGGRLGSPVGSVNVAKSLAELEEAIFQSSANTALSFLGRSTLSPATVTSPGAGDFGRFVSPSLGFGASTFATQAGIFGNQVGFAGEKLRSRTSTRNELIPDVRFSFGF
jgi:hypothetical protein